jgi:predicted CXXCH cytochrome family protein
MGKSSRRKATRSTAPAPPGAPVPPEAAEPVAAPWAKRAVGLLALVVLVGLACFWAMRLRPPAEHVAPAPALASVAGAASSAGAGGAATLVDEAQCTTCHAAEAEAWKGSHHAQAEALATPSTVRGDFGDARFRRTGTETRFHRQGDEFFVDTDGPDGRIVSFRVEHTFGVAPLQQYLLALPGGRLQALGIAWDTRKKAWFDLYPRETLTPADELHWTQRAQNWNFMCAECHTTGLRRNFDAAAGSYRTTWHALGVGCQDCHGPASAHVAWARGARDPALPAHGLAVDLAAGGTTLLETCARCHSRRAPLADGFDSTHRLSDDYALSLLTSALYEVDGHFKDEVFEYGSFAQSRMFMKGVTCTDCHAPHGGGLRAEGNAVCTACHNAVKPLERAGLDTRTLQRKDYDTPAHTHHAPGSEGARCSACHMPGKYYMQVDFRHDHALTIPRPDLGARLGTPDACTLCHQDKKPAWAARQLDAWFGAHPHPPGYGELMHALRHGEPGAAGALGQLVLDPAVPPIRRATALAEAARYPGDATLAAVRAGLKDPDPVVRAAAADAAGMLSPPARAPLLAPLLGDPAREVRITAARLLVDARDQLGPDIARWQQALEEYRSVQAALAERPESHMNLAGLALELGAADEAGREVDRALALAPAHEPALVMKSELLAAAGRPADAVALLQGALARRPESGLLHHALGLAQIRAGDRAAALASLRTAWQKSPQDALYGFVYAVALHDTGDAKAAIAQLDAVIARHPEDRDSAMTAVRYRLEAGDQAGAQAAAERWLKVDPGEPSLGRAGASAAPASR